MSDSKKEKPTRRPPTINREQSVTEVSKDKDVALMETNKSLDDEVKLVFDDSDNEEGTITTCNKSLNDKDDEDEQQSRAI